MAFDTTKLLNPEFGPSFGEAGYLPGGKYGPRTPSHIQIFYLTKGSVVIDCGDEQFQLSAGQAVMLMPGRRQEFFFSAQTNSEHGWCKWDTRPDSFNLDGFTKHFNAHRQVIDINSSYRQIADLGYAMQQVGNNPGAIRHLGMALFEEHCRLTLADQDVANDHVEKAMDYMKVHYASQISMDDLVENVHISLPHLNRLFKQHLKTTPSKYLWSIRLNRAVDLLDQTGLSLDQISKRCGYQTTSHFCQKFKKKYGLSPHQYRKQQWR